MMKPILLAAAALSLAAGAAQAAAVNDPPNDILATFIPSLNGRGANVDITEFNVAFDAASQDFRLGATFGGDVNGDNATIFVIGANTGSAANHPFGPGDTPPTTNSDPQDLNHAIDLGGNNISFNRTFIVHQDGSVFTSTAGPALANAHANIDGDSFSLVVPLSDFPAAANGFRPEDFTFNLWTRTGLGDNHQVADFAIANGMLAAGNGGTVPEPAAWALMIGGFGLTGAALRRQRRQRAVLAI